MMTIFMQILYTSIINSIGVLLFNQTNSKVHMHIFAHALVVSTQHLIKLYNLPLSVKAEETASLQVTISHTSAYHSSTHHCLCCTSCRKVPVRHGAGLQVLMYYYQCLSGTQ